MPERPGGPPSARDPAGAPWHRARAIFGAVAALAAVARDAYLRRTRVQSGDDDEAAPPRAGSGPAPLRDATDEVRSTGVPARARRAVLPAATRVGPYVLAEPLGRGSTAAVHRAYRAERLADGAVALKLLDVGAAATIGAERFLREVRIARSLSHRHIVPVLDSGSDAGRLWYAMPLYAGGTLRERLQRAGALSLHEARAVAADVAAALQHAHDAGVVHRDVKPANLLIGDDGGTVVADFGIARAFGAQAVGRRITATGMTVGTPRYMSPEQLLGEATLDGRADQYALACVLHEALVGAPAFGEGSPRVLMTRRFAQPPPSVRAHAPTVPESVDAALQRAMAIEPADRFPDLRSFARAFGA